MISHKLIPLCFKCSMWLLFCYWEKWSSRFQISLLPGPTLRFGSEQRLWKKAYTWTLWASLTAQLYPHSLGCRLTETVGSKYFSYKIPSAGNSKQTRTPSTQTSSGKYGFYSVWHKDRQSVLSIYFFQNEGEILNEAYRKSIIFTITFQDYLLFCFIA